MNDIRKKDDLSKIEELLTKAQVGTKTVGELRNQLKLLTDVKTVKMSTIDRMEMIGEELLMQKRVKTVNTEDPFLESKRKLSQVENGIIPFLDRPGSSPEASSIPERMEKNGVMGLSLTVLKGGQPISKSYGELQNPQTLIQAASISKTATALTVLSLVDQGILKLDEDVQPLLGDDLWKILDPDHITEGENPKVTVRMLLCHTAGFAILDEDGDSRTGFDGYKQTGERVELPTLDEILRGKTKSGVIKLVRPPGMEADYSGGHTLLLQALVEKVTGKKSFEVAVKEILFDKLGMEDSFFTPQEGRMATGYQDEGRQFLENTISSLSKQQPD